MNDKEQTDHFAKELDALVERFRAEYEMSYAAVVGTLQIKIHNLCVEGNEDSEQKD